VKLLILVALILSAPLGLVSAQARGDSPLTPPSGAYAVGRTQFDWIDSARTDAENPGGHREIAVWVWYPAKPAPGAERAEWMPGKWGESFWADYVGAHPNLADAGKAHPISSMRTHATADAPPEATQARFPIVLFAPGLGTTPLEYASLIEDVASHGYIVAAIVPTYFARATVLSNARVVPGRDIMAAVGGRGSTRPTTSEAIQSFEKAASIWSRDMTFTLNQLNTVNADKRSLLYGRFAFDRVGAMGHSLGGAAVLQVANDDRRVRAVFDIDGSPIWNRANKALYKPLVVLSAASTNVGYDAALAGATPGRHLRVAGTAHTFCSDMRLMPFTPAGAGNAGAIDPARAITIAAAYATSFFDRYLNGKTSSLLDGPSAVFPEVTFEPK
jgi:dienelactone hydrolase